ncbi:nectin-3-like protein isoform X1 [Scyliorhinus canicula]|uniref:nectin-3-like protein isoform X1 n=1 Tax=Scyliorhinus canicula TaxID=7830 RepID=UPI0018F74A4D|nr:nectin-3-like protein isoform X1 [Scyliorhinus canicula]XP_038657166.1 nectin-3-like protein isoform X1 [Scyliorhinus canicula]XP_038657167.1 nectin-3-like protein isoform X1 [Scyliorhinus canicula]
MNDFKDTSMKAAIIATFFITACWFEHEVHAVHLTTVLGNKINLNCSTNQSLKEIILIKWSRSITAGYQDIASYNADYGLFKFFKDDRLTISSCNGTCLQIHPVNLTDEGNYTCEITAFQGIFRNRFSLFVIVPPIISLNFKSLPNGLKRVQCIAAKSKPAAIITWKENTFGNSTQILVDNVDGTVTVESHYHAPINFTGQKQTCIINHPAFNATQNLTVSLALATEENVKMMTPQIKFNFQHLQNFASVISLGKSLVSFLSLAVLIICASALAVGVAAILVICIIKKKMKKIANSERRKQAQGSEDPIYQNMHRKIGEGGVVVLLLNE